MNKNISIVIPTYNEANNVVSLIERLHAALSQNNIEYELIFIDDHSTDKTAEAISSMALLYPITFATKQGKKGKAYSLFEGFQYAQYDHVAIIDADLQYPPEGIVEMLQKMDEVDIVVANRKRFHAGFIRKFLSSGFRTMFGKMLFGLNHDIQSGLKVFKRDVLKVVRFVPSSPWTFDLEFLHRAQEAGFTIGSHDITFEKRVEGKSKVNLLNTVYEIGSRAVGLKLTSTPPQSTDPLSLDSMKGAGVHYKKRKYVTHTTLPHHKSAITTFTRFQRTLIHVAVLSFLTGLILFTLPTLQGIVAVLSTIYFIDVLFTLYVILKSLYVPQEISVTDVEINSLDPDELPMYTILCPLYKEAHVIPQFVSAISKMEWPKDKLDVMLLLEEDDKESIEAVKDMGLPKYVRVVVVPDSQPKTKPKACNYGLAEARGEYLVIYDAEDMPDPQQLKKAYLSFKKVGPKVLCLQAKLNYYNPHQNLLTRFFTAEYSLWFDVTLTGLQSINTTIPLGGTSNHFRTKDLHMLQGWDPFNVTEDADLGMRLFKEGYKTAIIDSVTLEEANSKWGNWLRQRSRWIKGYMQTYLVHNRDIYQSTKKQKMHSLIFHLVIGGKIAFIIINPFLWLATISYFAAYAYVGPAIESLYPSYVFYMAVISLVFGNFLFMYYYMIGCMKREQYSVLKYTFLIPFYWIMISIAGGIALYQLFFKPHYWEKTVHGLHLLNKKEKKKFDLFKIPAKRGRLSASQV